MNSIKRILKNKNVITVLLVIVILVVLYIGYSASIKSKTDPVSIPVASRTIGPETQITASDVQVISVARSMVSDGVIQNTGAIIGKYTNLNVTIPEGSMFYSGWLVNEDEIPGEWIEKLDRENGEVGYYLPVNMDSTLGNSVKPNSYIDLYMKVTDENGTKMFGRLMKNIKVLVVHDQNGQNVFGREEVGQPSRLGFGVSKEIYELLNRSEELSVELVVAPRGYTVPTEDYVVVTSQTLRDYIDSRTTIAEENAVTE